MSIHTIFAIPLLIALQGEEPQPVPQERETIVTARRMADDPRLVPGSVTVLTREDLQRMPVDNVVDALRRTPGFFSFSSHRGPQDAVADFRGFNNGGGNGQRIVVLIDGRRHIQSGGDAVDWSTIPLDSIERIEIVRGPLAALQGNGGIAGVVNIVTRAPARETRLRLRGEAGSWNTLGLSGEATHGRGPVALYTFARGYRTDDYRANADFDTTDKTLRLSWDATEDLAFGLKVRHHRDDRQRPGTLSRTDIAAVGRRGVVRAGFPGYATIDEWAVDLSAKYTTGPGTLHAMLSPRWVDRASTSYFVGFGGFPGVFELDSYSDQWWGELRYELTSEALGRPLRVNLGIDASHERSFDPSKIVTATTSITRRSFRRRMYGAWALAEWELRANLRATAGLRWDEARYRLTQNTARGSPVHQHWAPLVGLLWEPRPELALFASWSRGMRFPNRDEQISFFPTLSVRPLEPEVSSSWELGARATPFEGVTTSITGFLLHVEDEIFFDPLAFMNRNIQEVVHRGVELEVEAQPWDWLLLFASYTNVLARVQEGPLEGTRWPVTPRQFGQVGATVFPADWLDVTLTALVLGARRGINDMVQTFELPPEARLDLQVNARWGTTRFFLQLQNLFNAEYHDNFGVGGGGVRRFRPAPEQSFLIGLEWTY